MIDKLLRDGNALLEEKGRSFPLAAMEMANPLRTTREYFDALQIELRVIDATEAKTKTRVYGQELATPIMTAALSSLGRMFPDGAVTMAKGAAAAGALVWTGIGDADELKAIIDTGAKTIKITKPYADTDLIFQRIAEAEQLGAVAVGMDIDFVFGGKKGPPPFPMAPKTLDDIKAFVKATKLPFILKGVLSESDTEKALRAGVSGIVVSHHGGAISDYTIPPLRILPRIAKLAAGRIPVFVDCGICRGLDAFKALALGANAVCVGKAAMAGLAVAGADGVRQVIEGMTEELRRAMSVTGSPDPEHIDPAVLWSPDRI